MKKITESQIRQVIREEILQLLNEISDVPTGEYVRTVEFSELLEAQKGDESAVRGQDFAELQKQNSTSLKPDTKIKLYANKKLNVYTAKLPLGEHYEMMTISKGIASKLGLTA